MHELDRIPGMQQGKSSRKSETGREFSDGSFSILGQDNIGIHILQALKSRHLQETYEVPKSADSPTVFEVSIPEPI